MRDYPFLDRPNDVDLLLDILLANKTTHFSFISIQLRNKEPIASQFNVFDCVNYTQHTRLVFES